VGCRTPTWSRPLATDARPHVASVLISSGGQQIEEDRMAFRIDLTLDCANPTRLAEFWKLALGYEDEPPPAPYATREEWLQQFDHSGDDVDDAAWLQDPAGAGPRLVLMQVPEPKVAKNRMHMDVRVSGNSSGDERWARIIEAVDRLTAAGGKILGEFPGHHVMMADPEGNEFDVL
jgi:Glyoxalase-like domain